MYSFNLYFPFVLLFFNLLDSTLRGHNLERGTDIQNKEITPDNGNMAEGRLSPVINIRRTRILTYGFRKNGQLRPTRIQYEISYSAAIFLNIL